MGIDTADAIASHVTDMLALERHLERALASQIARDPKGINSLTRGLRKVQETCERHVATLDALARRRSSGAPSTTKSVKQAASSVLGMSAMAVEFIQSEKLPKDLTDDYAAVSLMCVGYVMLHRSGLTRRDMEVAEVAYRHLQDHARSTMTLRSIKPARTTPVETHVRYQPQPDVMLAGPAPVEPMRQEELLAEP